MSRAARLFLRGGPLDRALRAASVALALVVGSALSIAPAHAASTVIPLDLKENDGNGKVFYHNLTVPTQVQGDGALTVEIGGNLQPADHVVKVYVDFEHVATLFEGVRNDLGCDGNAANPTPTATATVSIPQSVLADKGSDGQITLKFWAVKTGGGSISQSCVDSLKVCFSLRVASGSLTINEPLSPVEEKAISSTSMTKSRTTVTIANLPNLSKRMTNVGFQGAPSAPQAPSGGGTTGSGLLGGGLPGGGVQFSGSGTSSSGGFSFSGDLSGMRRAEAAKDLARSLAALGESELAGAGRRRAAFQGAENEVAIDAALKREAGQTLAFDGGSAPQRFDVWFGGSFSYFDTELSGVGQTGGVGTLQMGVDTRISEDLLVGVAVFGDFLRSDVSTGSQSEGLGVMAGPYAVANLDGDVYLELMAAYGMAYNRISSSGLADAKYNSERVLLTGRLSGDMTRGAWSFRPSTRVTYYSERQDSFDAGDGGIVGAERSELGQARLGPEIAYDLFWDDGAMRPFAGVEGVWAFKQSDQVVNGAVVAGEDLTASLSLGLDALLGETAIRAAGRYDGVGDADVQAVSGELTVRLPFN